MIENTSLNTLVEYFLQISKKWISSDKEIYGVICCLKKFALKLMHLPKFIIHTDCTGFLTFKEKDHGRKDGRGKYVHWQAYLN
jgi:hypothetical protein